MIGQTVGNLRIISEIGRGGMGVVYLAEHLSLKKKFAIKCLSSTLTTDPQFHKRFDEEARNQALLDHPNIVQATDFFEFDDQFFFVMEYVDGRDLGAIIKTEGHLPEKEAFAIFKNVLEGLHYAHGKNLIHRDVKPANILVDENGRARLMDFGIAIMVGRERLTATGSAVGSPWYMSPEQITNPLELDKRSDVYAAGIVLYEMLTGDVPFDGETDFAIKDQQVHTRPPDPCQRNPVIDAELAGIILKALEKDPDKRFQGCDEFLQRIKEYESGKITPPDGPWKKLIWLFVAIAIVSGGISLYLIYSPSEEVVVINKSDRELQHESAALWIQSAMEKAALVCREVNAIEIKRKNMHIAKEAGIPEMVHKYNTQIGEIERNIHDGIFQYKVFVEKLGGLVRPVVEEEFRMLVYSREAPVKSERARIVKDHYHQSLKKGMPSEDKIIRQLCAIK